MADKSNIEKVDELFKLQKDGTITKEEYEKLKKQVLSDVGIKSADNEKKQEHSNIETPDKPFQEKKGKKLWVFSFIGIALIAVVFALFKTNLFSGESKSTDIPAETVKDIDGNVYHTITIGSQVWMVENLRTTKYNDGTPIPFVTDNSTWRALTTPAYCWYNNDEVTNKNTFGALYNWYAVNTNKLCPEGWHVPSDSEWATLIDYLSKNGHGFSESGDDIGKSLANKTGWNISPDLGSVGNDPSSNNKSGFSAFASGIRFSNGEFRHIGQNSKWWSLTETSKTSAQIRFIAWEESIVSSYSNRKENGFSVRCVKDMPEQESVKTSSHTQANRLASQSKSNRNSRNIEYVSASWDEDAATKIIEDKLSKHPDWSGIYFNDSTTLIHYVSFFPKFDLINKDIMVGFAYSDYEENYCSTCSGVLSVFEFENKDGWYLSKKDIAFTSAQASSPLKIYPISYDNYGILITESHGTQGELNTFNELLAFNNDEVSAILEISHLGDIYTDYNVVIKKHEREGYFYLLVEETETKGATTDPFSEETDSQEESNPIITNTYYKFNGTKYESFVPPTTDPSLTSMDRFLDLNSIEQRKNGVCPTCNGTGIQICNLCGGTGVNNMGMECGCIRTYNMEKAAGHTPSHRPLKWTCIACNGSGK